jgi:hypothetical protein
MRAARTKHIGPAGRRLDSLFWLRMSGQLHALDRLRIKLRCWWPVLHGVQYLSSPDGGSALWSLICLLYSRFTAQRLQFPLSYLLRVARPIRVFGVMRLGPGNTLRILIFYLKPVSKIRRDPLKPLSGERPVPKGRYREVGRKYFFERMGVGVTWKMSGKCMFQEYGLNWIICVI